MQVDEFAHQIEARRSRLTSLHENVTRSAACSSASLSLPSPESIEGICCELRTALEELQVAQSRLCQPSKELVFNVEERFDSQNSLHEGYASQKPALSVGGESNEQFSSDGSTCGAVYQCASDSEALLQAADRVKERTSQLTNAFEQLNKEIAERKWIERELDRSLSLLQGTLEATVDGIIVSQNARYIAAFNQKFVEMWGIPESAIASRDLTQVVPLILEQLKDPEAFLDQAKDLLAQPDARGYGIFELKDGRVFERHSLPQQMGGSIVGRVCSFRDITDAFGGSRSDHRKRHEAALRESEERYRAVVEQTSDGIFLIDARSLRILDVNAAYCRLLGYTHEELLELTIYDLVAIDRETLEDSIRYALAEKRFLVSEARHRRKDGSEVDVEVSVTLISYGGREVFCVVVRDITERKQTEKKLREKEEFLQLILDNIPQFIFWKDRNFVYLGCNRNFMRAAGVKAPEEIVGKTDYDLPWKQEESDFFRACDARVMETNTPEYHIIEPQLQADGKQAWLDTNKIPLHDAKGNVVGILGTYEDITQRKLAEEALKQAKQELEIRVEERTTELRQAVTALSITNKQLHREVAYRQQTEATLAESEKRYRNLVETSQDIIWSLDVQGRFTFVNQAVQQIYGYEPAEMIGRPFADFQTEEQARQDWQVHLRVLAGESHFQYETVHLCKDGMPVHLSFNAIACRDDRGNIIGTTGTAHDITERKRIEKQLRNSEQMFRQLAENLPQVVFLKDFNAQQLLYVSPAYEQIWGRPCEELYEQPGAWIDAIHPDDRERICTRVHKRIQGERWSLREPPKASLEKTNSEYRIVKPDGSVRWISACMFPIRNETGQVYRSAGIAEDITDRKRAEEELRRSEAKYRELAQREALLNRLASQIRRSLDVDTILETAVQEIYKQLEIDVCLFAWYREEGTACGWDVVKEVKNPDLTSLLGLHPVEAWRPFTCMLGDAFGGSRSDHRDALRGVDERDGAAQPTLLPFDTEALLSLPIETQSGALGTIICGRLDAPRGWTDEELEMLQAVANQLIIGVNQAQLYEQSCIAAIAAQTKATQLEAALGELQQTQAQLIQTEKMSSLGQLVAGVAHEINNPLNFIHGNLDHVNQYTEDLLGLIQLYQDYYTHPPAEIQAEIEAIDLDFLKGDLPKILSSMQMGADRIRQIVLSLRNFSRAEQAEMKQVDIHEGLDNTLLILAHRLKAKPHHPTIEIVKEYEPLPSVRGYAGQLNQVFMNILTNAIDAIEERDRERSPDDIRNNPSTIWIRTEVPDSQQVLIRIVDNGPGMTEEVRHRLFDPFFTTKPVGQGTGLGMSISYQIVVERHGGHLQCISAPSQGAEFLVYLPLQPPAP